MLAFLRENGLNRIVMAGGPNPRLGIVSLGKSWLDTMGALDILGIDEKRAADLGIRLYKVAAPWPLEPSGVSRFAEGLQTVLVVEEKRSLVETQLKEQLYGRANAPMIIGKRDEQEEVLLPAWGALNANQIAVVIARRILAYADDSEIAARLKQLEHVEAVVRTTENVAARIPHFCAGCPHNTSTVVPEGSRAYAGIGCHYMAQWMDRRTEGFTQMGAEGANWIGEAPFSTRDHVFQNLGDGTYVHSGVLAIRAAAAAGVNITYKILYNDAVAMTGGQPAEGHPTVDRIARQVAAEGANRIVVVSDDPNKYPTGTDWPEGLTIHHRSELAEVQEEIRKVKGLSVLIYDQTCAAEKRRRRKRGLFPDPDKRVVINAAVCEGCGDCGVKSNCVAMQPLETEFGRKRTIDQSMCNKDFSCLEGFCPSFVTVHGGRLKKGVAMAAGNLPVIAEPELPPLDGARAILITGVGGTGVVTIGAVIGMAAHLDGLGVGIIDMAGLAQKGGAVTTHMRIAPKAEDIHAIRIAAEQADTVLACDIVVAGSKGVLSAIRPGETKVFVNRHETYPGDFTRDADFSLPTRRLAQAIEQRAGAGHARIIEAQRLATALNGDAMATNMFMVGFAWQQGGLPVSYASILEAIRLNGVAVDMNIAAFEWGRRAADDLAEVERGAGFEQEEAHAPSLAEIVARRVAFLTAYQNAALRGALPRAGGQDRRARAAPPPPDRDCDGGGAFPLQADGGEGRIRGGAPLHRRLIRAAARRTVRELGVAAVPSGAAALRAPRQAHRSPQEAALRAVDDGRLQAAGAPALPAPHNLRSVPLRGGAALGAAAPEGLPGRSRRHRGEALRRQCQGGAGARRLPGKDPRLRPREGGEGPGRAGQPRAPRPRARRARAERAFCAGR